VVSDNLKAGVTKACFYEPAINRTYADMAMHYDRLVLALRFRLTGQGDPLQFRGTSALLRLRPIARILSM